LASEKEDASSGADLWVDFYESICKLPGTMKQFVRDLPQQCRQLSVYAKEFVVLSYVDMANFSEQFALDRYADLRKMALEAPENAAKAKVLLWETYADRSAKAQASAAWTASEAKIMFEQLRVTCQDFAARIQTQLKQSFDRLCEQAQESATRLESYLRREIATRWRILCNEVDSFSKSVRFHANIVAADLRFRVSAVCLACVAQIWWLRRLRSFLSAAQLRAGTQSARSG